NFRSYTNASLMEPYTNQAQATDAKGNNLTTNIAVTVSQPKLDTKRQPMLTNGEPVMVDVPQLDAKGQPIMTNMPVMVDAKVDSQAIPAGPAASQIAIKQLGTNGGGFYGQNSSHPFENPTPFSNFVEMLGLLILAASLVYSFGIMVGNVRHARVLFGVMLLLLV